MNTSRIFFEQIDKVANLEVPANVLSRARCSLLDYLAVTCAGARFQEEKIRKYFDFAQPESGNFSVIGTDKRVVLKEAVFLNGLNSHALDFDDGTNSGIIHLGSPVFSLLIPLAQRYGISAEAMLKAAVIGYEASYTMAVSIQPQHKALGYHATGTCGTIGAALAAAYMLGFTEEERFNAFSAACLAASGILKVLDDGAELKPYNVAKTALLALTSLQLSKAGFKGHSDPLGGYRGFLKMMSGDENTEIKPTLLNGTYAIMKSYTKPYASCRYTHPPVEASIRLRNKYNVRPESIESINISTYDLAVSGHDHTDIQGAYSAKMSTPYSVAVAFVYGKAGLKEFSEDALNNSVVKAVTKKVKVLSNSDLSKAFPQKQPAEMKIIVGGGTIYSERVDYPKGEPENPLSETEFYSRYEDLMVYGGIEKDAYDEVYHKISDWTITVEELIRILKE